MTDKRLDILMISYWDFQECGMQVIKLTPLYFAKQGHRVTFIVHSETTANPSMIRDLHPNLTVIRLNLPFKLLNAMPPMRRIRQLLLFSILSIFHTLRVFSKGRKPDIIYAAEADAVIIGSLLKRIYNVPLIARFYGIARITAYFDFETRKLRSSGFKHLASRIALTRKAAMTIVTDDGSMGFDVIKAINPHAGDIRFWRNGIDRNEVLPDIKIKFRRIHAINADDFVLMTICRLDPMKRVDRAIRALHSLRGRGIKNVRLLIVGQGEEQEHLEQLSRELGTEKSVEFIGAVTHDSIYEYYAVADIFLSLYDLSNVGNPLWEALNSSCCIVTLNTGGTGQVIKDGINGRLLEVGTDEDELAERLGAAIEELYNDPDHRRYLSGNAREYSSRNLWTWDERLETELKAILNLAGKH